MTRIQHLRSGAALRGIVGSVMANGDSPAALIGQLNAAFSAFRQNNDSRMEKIEAELDRVLKSQSLGRITSPDGSPLAEILKPLGAFIQSGALPSASMNVGEGSKGGYTVGESVENVIRDFARTQSTMRRIATVRSVPMGVSEHIVTLTNDRAAHGGWVSEQGTRSETTAPTLAEITIPLHEHYAEPRATQRLLDDSRFNIAAYLESEIVKTMTDNENPTFITGNGVAKPEGILVRPTSTATDATRPIGTVQYIATGEDGGFKPAATGVLPGDCLYDVVAALNAEYRTNGRWVMNSLTAAVVRKMKDAEGNYLWQNSIMDGQPDRLLGYPVEYDESMPDIASGTLSIAFGDFARAYMIIDRDGMTMLRDPYTTKGYVKFYTSKRVGGGVIDSRAYKLLKFSAS